MTMRLVVLTSGTVHAERVLLGLSVRECLPDAIILAGRRTAKTSRAKQLKRIAKRRPRDIAQAGLRRVAAKVEGRPPLWPALAREVHTGMVLNSPEMVERLRSLAPDYVLLIDAGIVSGELLSVPSRGTLNFHPALLPWVPGVGVVERAVERGVAVGVTGHFVDEGIDTGPLVHREIVPVDERDTLQSLREKADERSIQITVDVVSAAMAGEHPKSAVQREKAPYSGWPTSDEIAAVEAKIADGAAVRHYQEWRERYGGLVLPLPEQP